MYGSVSRDAEHHHDKGGMLTHDGMMAELSLRQPKPALQNGELELHLALNTGVQFSLTFCKENHMSMKRFLALIAPLALLLPLSSSRGQLACSP